MIRHGVSYLTPKPLIRRIGVKVKKIKFGTVGITIDKVSMLEMETITTQTN